MNLDNEQREKLQALFRAIADVLDLALRQARDRQPTAAAQHAQQPAQRPPPTITLDQDRLWDVADVAKYLRASRSWVYNAAADGTLPCLRIGAMLRFEPDAVMRSIGLDVPVKAPPVASKSTARRHPTPMGFTQPAEKATKPPEATWTQPSEQPPASTQPLRPPPRPPPVAYRPIESMLSARQAAERLGICTATLYKLCETGELAHHRISNAIKVLPEDLEQLRAARATNGKKPNPTVASAAASPSRP